MINPLYGSSGGGGGAVTSVAGRAGAVVVGQSDIADLTLNPYALKQSRAFAQEIAANGLHTYNALVSGDSRVDSYGTWAYQLLHTYCVRGGVFDGMLLLNVQGNGSTAPFRPDGTTPIPSGNWDFGTSGGTLSAWTTGTASTGTGYTYGNVKTRLNTAIAANSGARPNVVLFQDYGTNDMRLGLITQATFLQRLKDAYTIYHADFPNGWLITNMQILGPFASGAAYIQAPSTSTTVNGYPPYNDGSGNAYPVVAVAPTFTVTITAGAVTAVTTNTAGSNLPAGSLFVISSNSGLGATIAVTISGGAVSGNPTVLTGGGGYTSATVGSNLNATLGGTWQATVDALNASIRGAYDAFQIWANQNGYKVIVVDTHRRMAGLTAAGVIRYNPQFFSDSLHPTVNGPWRPEAVFANDIATELSALKYSNFARNEGQYLSGSTGVNDANGNPQVPPHTIDVSALQDPASYDLVYAGTCWGVTNSSTTVTLAMDYGQPLPNQVGYATNGGWTVVRTGDIVLFGPASSDVNYPGYAWQIPLSAVSVGATRSGINIGRLSRNYCQINGATSGTIVPSGVSIASGSVCRVYRYRGNVKQFDPNISSYLGDPNYQITHLRLNGAGSASFVKLSVEDQPEVIWNATKFISLVPGDILHFVGYPNDYTVPAGVFGDYIVGFGTVTLSTLAGLTDPNGIAWAYPDGTSVLLISQSPKVAHLRVPQPITLVAPPATTLVNGTKCAYMISPQSGYVDRITATLITANTSTAITFVIRNESQGADVATITFGATSTSGSIAWASGSSATYALGDVFSVRPTATVVSASGLLIAMAVQ